MLSMEGFIFFIFIVFTILKLIGLISWSWWWVTSPILIPIAIVLAGLGLQAVVGLVTIIGWCVVWFLWTGLPRLTEVTKRLFPSIIQSVKGLFRNGGKF